MLITILSFALVFIITLIAKKYDEYANDDYFRWEIIFLFTFIFGMFTSIIIHVLTIPFTIEQEYKKIEKDTIYVPVGTIENNAKFEIF